MRNFLSIGNVSQAVTLDQDGMMLILGENLDQGGNDSRNGTGKSSLANALCYGLFGDALVKIKKSNLVNKVNSKLMMVTVDFEKDGIGYRIERGRSPNIFRFMVNGSEFNSDETDEAQGDGRLTQIEIERIIGISIDMFKQIISLNTSNEPFLSMRPNDQRAVIEQLLGITTLSEKADLLKDQVKNVRDSIQEETHRISAVESANKRIAENIKMIQTKSNSWETKKENRTTELCAAINVLLNIDIDDEIKCHKQNAETEKDINEVAKLTAEKKMIDRDIVSINKKLNKSEQIINARSQSKNCPTCDSVMNDDLHEQLIADAKAIIEKANVVLIEKNEDLEKHILEINNITIVPLLQTFYKNIDTAYDHKSSMDKLAAELENNMADVNPFTDQIDILTENGLEEVNYDKMNALTDLKNHQDFLLKLLSNKESHIRKKIISQNLLYLNARLAHYLEKIGLPHGVTFESDLNVTISQYGKDFDFENLSRGEKTRLILALSWSFRDVYESLNSKINLLFIDELIDNGLDCGGANDALAIMRNMANSEGKNVFLVSHRVELVGRISSVLKVTKSNGFTSFSVETN